LQNLYIFNKAIVANSLWRVLMKDGIWHRVIKDKYFPHILVTFWLIPASQNSTSTSQIWRNMKKTLPIIIHWLRWKPGDGHEIIVGRDMILGMGSSSFLSKDLITLLNENNVYYVFQAYGLKRQGAIFSQWKDSVNFNFTGHLAKEWDLYCKGLAEAGIMLLERHDKLNWIGGISQELFLSKIFMGHLLQKYGHKNLWVGGELCGSGI